MTTSALRGSLRWRSLRLCSRAPEMTISPALWGTCPRLASGPRVNLVQQVVLVGEVEVLPQIAGCFLARRARQGHVQRDQAGAFAGGAAVAAVAFAGRVARLLDRLLDDLGLRVRRPGLVH